MSNNVQVMELFPTPVFIAQATEVDNQRLCQLIYGIRDAEIADGAEKKVGASNLGGFHTYDLLRVPGFEELKRFIVATLNNSLLKGKWFAEGEIDESYFVALWSIINKRGHANSTHNHANSWFSGVYYPKVPKDTANAGPLCFRDPIVARSFTRAFYRSVQSEVCSIPPQEGRLILFPGWVEHSTRPNETDEDRIAISFNIEKKRV